MVEFKKAKIEDAEALMKVQKRTFDDDSRKFAGNEMGGPPGYDLIKWQIDMMQQCKYYKILSDDIIIGGIIIIKIAENHYELGRIYIDPDYQNEGIGYQAMKFIDEEFDGCQKWTLGTPDWAVRNHYFYKKCGFKKVGLEGPLPEGFMEVRFEKIKCKSIY